MPSAAGVVAFGVFDVDLRSGELRKRGVRVQLQHQPFRILVRLLESPGELVTREDLRRELWPDDTFVDFEHGLNAAVKRLREALGDSADTPRFIETLPRRGYRFVAPIAPVSQATAASPGAPTRESRQPMSRRSWLLLAVAAVVLIGSGVTMVRARRPALTDRDTILVSDFVNHTGDAIYDGTLRQALTIDLGQSPFLTIVPRERVRDTLKQMRLATDIAVLGPVAREVCERTGARLSVNGDIAAIGRQLLVTLEAVNCASGGTIAEEQATVADRDQVLNALHAAASALRRKVGESVASLDRFNAPLRQATTASLEALRTFSAAEEIRERQGDSHAEPLYRKALEIDPDFAMAYARLSAVAANTGHPAAEITALTKEAMARRDRVTERERIYVDYRACALATDTGDCGIHVADVWRRTYPRDSEPYQQLCYAYTSTRAEFERALPDCLEGVRLNPYNSVAVVNLAAAYRALNRFEEAKRVTDGALSRGVVSTTLREIRYRIACVEGDRNAMAAEAQAMSGDVDEPRFMLVEGEALAFEGRFAAARAMLAGAEARDAGRVPGFSWRARVKAAIFEAAAGFPVGADVYTPERSGFDLMLAMLRRDMPYAETLLGGAERPNLPARLRIPARVLFDVERGSPDAIRRLPPPDPTELGSSAEYRPIYLRGLAYLRAGDGVQAIAEFQRILDHRGVNPTSALYPLSLVQQARAYMLSGDGTGARHDYERFFGIWKRADADAPILTQARSEYAKLGAP